MMVFDKDFVLKPPCSLPKCRDRFFSKGDTAWQNDVYAIFVRLKSLPDSNRFSTGKGDDRGFMTKTRSTESYIITNDTQRPSANSAFFAFKKNDRNTL